MEPERYIAAALQALLRQICVTDVSTFYRTKPLGRPEQASFVNGMWKARTAVAARELKFGILRPIEAQLGRVRTQDKYAPRPIDLDIAVYGDAVISETDLVIPAPDILARPFLAVPLLELAPGMRLPGTNLLLAALPIAKDIVGLEPMYDLTETLRRRITI